MIKLLDGIGTAGDGFDEDAAMESVGKSALKRLKRRAREEPKDDDDDEYDEAALTPPEPLVNVKEGGAGDKGESELSSEEELVPIATVAVANSSPTKAGRKKDLPATYQPDVRSLGWLKVKKDYIEGGVGDSLDLVPIGAWHGSGRKAGWWSPILLACVSSSLPRSIPRAMQSTHQQTETDRWHPPPPFARALGSTTQTAASSRRCASA